MNFITHNNLDLRSILSDKGISRTNFRSKLVYLFYSSNRSGLFSLVFFTDSSSLHVFIFCSLPDSNISGTLCPLKFDGLV